MAGCMPLASQITDVQLDCDLNTLTIEQTNERGEVTQFVTDLCDKTVDTLVGEFVITDPVDGNGALVLTAPILNADGTPTGDTRTITLPEPTVDTDNVVGDFVLTNPNDGDGIIVWEAPILDIDGNPTGEVRTITVDEPTVAETDGVHFSGQPTIDAAGIVTFPQVNDLDESVAAPLTIDLSSLISSPHPEIIGGGDISVTQNADGDWVIESNHPDLIDVDGPDGVTVVQNADGDWEISVAAGPSGAVSEMSTVTALGVSPLEIEHQDGEGGTYNFFPAAAPDLGPATDETDAENLAATLNPGQMACYTLPTGCRQIVIRTSCGFTHIRPEAGARQNNVTIAGASRLTTTAAAMNSNLYGNVGPIATSTITNPDPCRPAIVNFFLDATTTIQAGAGESFAVAWRAAFDKGDGNLALWSTGQSVQYNHSASGSSEAEMSSGGSSWYNSTIIPAGGSITVRAQSFLNISAQNLSDAQGNQVNPTVVTVQVIDYNMTTLNQI